MKDGARKAVENHALLGVGMGDQQLGDVLDQPPDPTTENSVHIMRRCLKRLDSYRSAMRREPSRARFHRYPWLSPPALLSGRVCSCTDRHMTVSANPALSHQRVSPTWRIRHRSAITREIPPRDRENLQVSQLHVGSQSAWRMAMFLTGRLQNSHRNGGRVFLIFVADPRTLRLCTIRLRSVTGSPPSSSGVTPQIR